MLAVCRLYSCPLLWSDTVKAWYFYTVLFVVRRDDKPSSRLCVFVILVEIQTRQMRWYSEVEAAQPQLRRLQTEDHQSWRGGVSHRRHGNCIHLPEMDAKHQTHSYKVHATRARRRRYSPSVSAASRPRVYFWIRWMIYVYALADLVESSYDARVTHSCFIPGARFREHFKRFGA